MFLCCVWGLLVLANIGLAEASPLTIAVNLTSSGAITLTAGDSVNPGDDFTVNPGVTIQSTAGSIIVQAGDNLIFNSTATLTAAVDLQMVVDFGNADPGAGGIANVQGDLNAPLATLSGGPDNDSFVIVPDDNTPIVVHGAGGSNALTYQGTSGIVTFSAPDHRSGTISAPGVADVTFDNIDAISGATTAAQTPEPATWFLVLAALPGFLGYGWRRCNQDV